MQVSPDGHVQLRPWVTGTPPGTLSGEETEAQGGSRSNSRLPSWWVRGWAGVHPGSAFSPHSVSGHFSLGDQAQSGRLPGRLRVGSLGSALRGLPPGPGRAAGRADGGWDWGSEGPVPQWKPWGAPLWLSRELLPRPDLSHLGSKLPPATVTRAPILSPSHAVVGGSFDLEPPGLRAGRSQLALETRTQAEVRVGPLDSARKVGFAASRTEPRGRRPPPCSARVMALSSQPLTWAVELRSHCGLPKGLPNFSIFIISIFYYNIKHSTCKILACQHAVNTEA